MTLTFDEEITTLDRLRELMPLDPNSNAANKVDDHINETARQFIELSPFVVLTTIRDLIDVSPKGDPQGFVEIYDEKTLIIPDRPGNNRADGHRNILIDPRVGLLFLIPGIRETLRINGTARISVDPELLESFAIKNKIPKTVLVVTVDRIYFQCSKAMVRSKLWLPEAQVERSEVPTAGAILQEISNNAFDGEEYDRNYPDRILKTIY